jgi:hypothetical protein
MPKAVRAKRIRTMGQSRGRKPVAMAARYANMATVKASSRCRLTTKCLNQKNPGDIDYAPTRTLNNISNRPESNSREFHRTTTVRAAEGDRHILPARTGSGCSSRPGRRPHTCTPRSQGIGRTSRLCGIGCTTDLPPAAAPFAPVTYGASATILPMPFGLHQTGRRRRPSASGLVNA